MSSNFHVQVTCVEVYEQLVVYLTNYMGSTRHSAMFLSLHSHMLRHSGFSSRPKHNILKFPFPSHPTHYSYNQFLCQHIDVPFGWEFPPDAMIWHIKLVNFSCFYPVLLLWRQFCFSIKVRMGIRCSSRHTFAPIDSTFCTPGIYM